MLKIFEAVFKDRHEKHAELAFTLEPKKCGLCMHELGGFTAATAVLALASSSPYTLTSTSVPNT